MTAHDPDRPPIQEPLADLERALIAEYLAEAGQDLPTLLARTDQDAHRLLADASRYAAGKLAEVETRSHYVRRLHGPD